jgi:NAD(P)-dependent dehydrogenase (short-subunit alcohol dehydrogenase family)
MSEAAAVPRTPSFRLDGRRALVAGGGRGLGRACALALAEAGAAVTIAARTAGEIETVAQEIRGVGGSAGTLAIDLRDTPSIEGRLAPLAPFDILVNSAGTNRPGPFVEAPEENFDAIVDLNLKALFFLTQAVTRGMIAAGRGGAIVNISSQMGHVGAVNRTIYCASKHAVEGFTKALAVELAPHNIRVNSLAPTFIETPMTEPFFRNKAFRDDTLARIKLGRLGQVEDIMGAVVLLASDAGALITGTSLVVDGGWTAE